MMATDLNTLLHELSGNGMTNERVKTLPAKELGLFLSIEIFYEQTQETQPDKRYKPATIPNFQHRIVQNDWKKGRTVIERNGEKEN